MEGLEHDADVAVLGRDKGAATRQDLDGQPPGGWLADQKLTAVEALRGFTADAAYASFDEAHVGQLRTGMRADFLIVEDDPDGAWLKLSRGL